MHLVYTYIAKSDCWSNHVCLFIRLREATRLPLDRFNEIWYVSLFLKFVGKIQVTLNSDKDTGTLHEAQYVHKCIFVS